MHNEKSKERDSRHNNRKEDIHRHPPLPERGKNEGSQDKRRHEGGWEHHKES